LDFLSNIVQQVITFLYGLTNMLGVPSYGLAIVIMTVIVKLILYPLTSRLNLPRQ
jgi:YidC/Oxa1 family membrane protein insertase